MDPRRFLPPMSVLLRHPWVEGDRLRVSIRRHVTYWRRGLRSYEPHLARTLLQEIKPDWTVVEVGAHVGFFTLLLAARARHVIAFEPDAQNRHDLHENLRRNTVRNVRVVGAACSNETGVSTFVTDPATGSAGGLGLWHHGEHAGPATPVPTVRLDAFLPLCGAPVPDLVKIDAEGAEDAVLDGMGVLLDGPTRLIVEVNKASMCRVQDRLRGHGYRILNPHMGLCEQPPGTYAGWHAYAVRD